MEFVDKLANDLRDGNISRRAFVRRATAMGISGATAALIAREALAQSATPEATPVASPVSGEVTHSMTREEYLTQLYQNFPMSDAAVTGGQIIMPSIADMSQLNPHIRVDIAALYVISPVFSSLVSGAPWDATLFGPDLADSWTGAADGVTFTFNLNPNAMFHDGMPVTAHDVVFSYDTMMAPDSLAVAQADFLLHVASYRAIDDHTFEIVAKQPSPLFFPTAISNISILPKHIWEPIPLQEWGSAPGATGADPSQVVGSGPFKFLEWIPNDHATVVRNDDYWVSELIPKIDSFTFRVIPESNAVVQTLLTGETDFTGLQASQVETVTSSDPNIAIYDYDTWRHEGVIPNLGEKGTLFKELPVRQALYYGLDRQLIVDSILLGYAVQADGPQPPPSPAYAPELLNTIYNYDPDKARQLLDEAGWVDSDGDGVREKGDLKLEADFYYVDSATGAQLVAYFQQAWGEIGIRINPTPEPQPTYIERLNQGNFEIGMIGITWINQGDQGIIYSTSAAPPNGVNFGFWSNAEYDELNAQQLAELDPEKRREILIQMSNIVNDDAASILIAFTKGIVAAQPRVQNIYPNGIALPIWSLSWMWIDENA